MRELNEVQRLLYRLITAPDGVAAGMKAELVPLAAGLDAVIRGDERLSAVERLDIYANGYFYRILDALKEDYSATSRVLGGENFHNLVTGYLIEHRPAQPSLYNAGEFLPEFLAGHPLRQRWPFIAELARLERSIIEVFHASDDEPLDAAMLRSVPPADWPRLILRTARALDILDCEWPVDEVLRAIEEKRAWADPRNGPVSILVWRQNFQVYYREIDIAERDALRISRDGASFANICEVTAAAAPDKDAVEAVGRLLNRWLADGVFARL